MVAFPAKEILPDASPVDCGVKVTVKVALCPAAKVKGRDKPLRTNSALLELADVTITLAEVAVRVSAKLLLVPTGTVPKLKGVGETESCPGAATVPDKDALKLGFVAFEVTFKLPLALPADCGANVMLTVRLCPAPSEAGRVRAPRLKPAPLAAICEMVTLVPPELVMVSDFV